MPDPTLLYRQPNAPRRRTRPQPPVPAPPTVPRAPTTPPTVLRHAIDDALKCSTEILDSDRFAQAADAVEAVTGPAARMLGSESPDLLKLRFHRALILFLGGDSRTALPESRQPSGRSRPMTPQTCPRLHGRWSLFVRRHLPNRCRVN